ncbi:MAG: DNA primase [Planctomycetes bacterium]|nr:DNA primase [Planctomycetota bacterium]
MTGKFDNAIISQVQQANDIVDVVSEHVNLVKKGRELVGVCPFHSDHRPSMYVSPVKQIFKCFACGAGGDVFKFIQMRENLTFPQAVERLAEKVGIKLKPIKYTGKGQKSVPDVDPNQLARVNEWAAKYFQANLKDKQKGKAARDYVAERQINQESVDKWRIGLAIGGGNDLVNAAAKKNIPMDLLGKAGLVVGGQSDYKDKFINRLMFTITDVTGRVIGFGGRTLDNAPAKYMNSPATVLFDKSNSMYGLEQGRLSMVSTGQAVVVEGYTDVIMAHQAGCNNVIATLGTSFTAGHGRILRRYAKNIVILFDNDVAGNEAANRALEVCLSQHIDIKLATVPQGKDPCDFVLASGREEFEKVISSATDVFRFKWDRLKDNFENDQTLAGNKAAIEEFLQTIAVAISSGKLPAIDRGLIVNRLSRVIGLNTKQINSELDKRIARSVSSAAGIVNSKVVSADLGKGLYATAQREILEVLLNESRFFDSIKEKFSVEIFDVPVLRQIAEILFEKYSQQRDVTLAAVLSATESAQLSSCIVMLAEAGEEKGNYKKMLNGAIEVVEKQLEKNKVVQPVNIEEQTMFLKSITNNAGKDNRHNVGMV